MARSKSTVKTAVLPRPRSAIEVRIGKSIIRMGFDNQLLISQSERFGTENGLKEPQFRASSLILRSTVNAQCGQIPSCGNPEDKGICRV